jgi:hypothetical protein
MTEKGFRDMALGFPEAVESAHMGHPDFRVNKKVFATLRYPKAGWGVVKLTPEQQARAIEAEPEAFAPCNGAWGRQGYTNVKLRAVKKGALERALTLAWRNVAPARLVDTCDADA